MASTDHPNQPAPHQPIHLPEAALGAVRSFLSYNEANRLKEVDEGFYTHFTRHCARLRQIPSTSGRRMWTLVVKILDFTEEESYAVTILMTGRVSVLHFCLSGRC